jgi:hypothetical protein
MRGALTGLKATAIMSTVFAVHPLLSHLVFGAALRD